MKRTLIVNADDCNLTRGVTKAILDCHDKGILTSTTFMVNLPLVPGCIEALIARPGLGVGIHLNVTLGKPIAPAEKVRSLLAEHGNFRKVHDQLARPPHAEDLILEYASQVGHFFELFGRKPTHLDTHHQVHDHPLFFEVLCKVAVKNKLPVRRSRCCDGKIKTTDFLFGNLTVEGYWRKEPLETILKNLPQGVSEIMCHPGKNDAALRAISSFTSGREAEWKLFRSPTLKEFVTRQGITLTHFGLCYTF